MEQTNQNQSELSVLSFNTWGLKVGTFSIARKIDQRLQAMTAEISKLNADVISFQEVWTDEAASFLYHNLNYQYYYYNPVREAFKGYMGNGLLILSKYPIVQQECVFFNHHTAWFEYYAHKGILSVQIETPSGYFSLLNTHLGSGNKIHHVQKRKEQLTETLNYIDKLSAKQPIILTGDFNFNPASEEYRIMDRWKNKTFNDESFDAYHKSNPEGDGFTFYINRTYKINSFLHGINERIDYIFALCAKENRSALELLQSEVVFDHADFPLSDHCGVMAKFLIRKKMTVEEVIESEIPVDNRQKAVIYGD
jgi:endonuclease/exonuclease/phosphatase family metal-dependent hydrolase